MPRSNDHARSLRRTRRTATWHVQSNGIVAAGATLGLGASGHVFGLDILTTSAVLLLALMLGAVIWITVRADSPVGERRVSPPRPQAGGTATVDLDVRATRRPTTVRLSESVSGLGSVGIWFGRQPAGHATTSYALSELRRGIITIGPLLADSGDPFGFLRRRTEIAAVTHHVVLPRLVDVEGIDPDGLAPGDDATTPHGTTDGTDAEGLREWSDGDDIRHVHWSATARHQRPIVRTFEHLVDRQPVVIADTNVGDDDFELVASAAASLIAALTDGGQTARLILTDADPASLLDPNAGSGRRDDLIDRLAMAHPSSTRLAPGKIVESISVGASGTFVVTASPHPAIDATDPRLTQAGTTIIACGSSPTPPRTVAFDGTGPLRLHHTTHDPASVTAEPEVPSTASFSATSPSRGTLR